MNEARVLKHLVVIGVALTSALASAGGVVALGPHLQTPRIEKAADGHFWADASVNGKPLRLLVDTGATTVALTREDAQSLGLAPETLDFEQAVSTAGGGSRAARVVLDHVAVAGAPVSQVEALVFEEGLPTSLLGMSYLGRLEKFEATRTDLVLRP